MNKYICSFYKFAVTCIKYAASYEATTSSNTLLLWDRINIMSDTDGLLRDKTRTLSLDSLSGGLKGRRCLFNIELPYIFGIWT